MFTTKGLDKNNLPHLKSTIIFLQTFLIIASLVAPMIFNIYYNFQEEEVKYSKMDEENAIRELDVDIENIVSTLEVLNNKEYKVDKGFIKINFQQDPYDLYEVFTDYYVDLRTVNDIPIESIVYNEEKSIEILKSNLEKEIYDLREKKKTKLSLVSTTPEKYDNFVKYVSIILGIYIFFIIILLRIAYVSYLVENKSEKHS